MAFRFNVAICALYKNEGPYLLEWLEYHRLIGVDHFYLYNNRSTDNHEELLFPYIQGGIVTKHEYGYDFANSDPDSAWKSSDYPYIDCIFRHKDESEWIGFIDLDEFIHVYQDRSIKDMMARYKDYGGLAIQWLLFGSSGHYINPTGSILQNYTLRYPRYEGINGYVKSIINPRLWISWQNAHVANMQKPIVYSNYTPCTHLSGPHIDHSVCSLHHYYAKSKWYYIYVKMARVFDVKVLRTSIVNTHDRKYGTFAGEYYTNAVRWEHSNTLEHNCVEDTSLASLSIPKISTLPKIPRTYLNRTFLDLPAVQTYANTNFDAFYGQSMSIAFHYWFIFNESSPREYLTSSQDDTFFQKYDNPEFVGFINSWCQRGIERKETIPFSIDVARQFYYTYEYWLPPRFNVKSYIELNSGLGLTNSYEAIVSWMVQGRIEHRSYSPLPEIALPSVPPSVPGVDPLATEVTTTTHVRKSSVKPIKGIVAPIVRPPATTTQPSKVISPTIKLQTASPSKPLSSRDQSKYIEVYRSKRHGKS